MSNNNNKVRTLRTLTAFLFPAGHKIIFFNILSNLSLLACLTQRSRDPDTVSKVLIGE